VPIGATLAEGAATGDAAAAYVAAGGGTYGAAGGAPTNPPDEGGGGAYELDDGAGTVCPDESCEGVRVDSGTLGGTNVAGEASTGAPATSGRLLGSSHSPQNRHLAAASWICSAQNGQAFTAKRTLAQARLPPFFFGDDPSS
jgi:hypothetical protein